MDGLKIFDFDLVLFLTTSRSEMLTDEEENCNSSSSDSSCQDCFSEISCSLVSTSNVASSQAPPSFSTLDTEKWESLVSEITCDTSA